MSAMLRTPHVVPSLFARGLEGDGCAMSPLPPAGRFTAGVARLRHWTSEDAAAALVRYVPALLFSSGTLVLVGRPLVRAATLAVGMGPAH